MLSILLFFQDLLWQDLDLGFSSQELYDGDVLHGTAPASSDGTGKWALDHELQESSIADRYLWS